MKKSELTDLINRKKILSESMEIVEETKKRLNELGGYDSPELLSHYHGNYYDELTKLFFRFDELVDPLGSTISKTIKDDEIEKSREILKHFISFMESYLNYLQFLKQKGQEYDKKYPNMRPPSLGNTERGDFELNEDI